MGDTDPSPALRPPRCRRRGPGRASAARWAGCRGLRPVPPSAPLEPRGPGRAPRHPQPGLASAPAGHVPCAPRRQVPGSGHPTRSTDPEAKPTSEPRAFSTVFLSRPPGRPPLLHVLKPLTFPPRGNSAVSPAGGPSRRPRRTGPWPSLSSGHVRQSRLRGRAGDAGTRLQRPQRCPDRAGEATVLLPPGGAGPTGQSWSCPPES